jgi:hypothetical protein
LHFIPHCLFESSLTGDSSATGGFGSPSGGESVAPVARFDSTQFSGSFAAC